MKACAPPLSAAISRMPRMTRPSGRSNIAQMWLNNCSKSPARQSFGLVPDRHRRSGGFARHVAEQFGLENIVACQRLTGVVEHREHLMGAVDVGGRDVHHVAAVEQEIDDLSSLARVVGPQRRNDVSARFEDSLRCRRVRAIRAELRAWRPACGRGHGKTPPRVPAATVAGARQPRRPADRRQQAQIRGLAVFRVEVAQSAEQDGERRQPLKTVDHVENPAGAGPRPARAPRGRALTLDEQHRAQEVLGAIDR